LICLRKKAELFFLVKFEINWLFAFVFFIESCLPEKFFLVRQMQSEDVVCRENEIVGLINDGEEG